MTDAQFSINEDFYESERAVSHYLTFDRLRESEVRILARHAAGGDLLDLGVGAGRTVLPLTAIANRYTGIDYSSAMIAACRSRFPAARLFQSDIRDMRIFSDRTFDSVCGLFNGLDDLGHDDRRTALYEIKRVLKAGGLFLFSAHNRAVLDVPDDDDGYAIVVETLLGSNLPTYYVTRGAQTSSLIEAGFDVLEVSGIDGFPLPAGVDSRDAWLYYAARRAA